LIVTVARLAPPRRPSSLTARRRPLAAPAGTVTAVVVFVGFDVLVVMLSASPLPPRKTILRTRSIERPRTRSTLPVCAASMPEQPATHFTELTFGETDE